MGKQVFRSLALTALLGTAMGLSAPAPAEATLMYPDVVIFYFFSSGPIPRTLRRVLLQQSAG